MVFYFVVLFKIIGAFDEMIGRIACIWPADTELTLDCANISSNKDPEVMFHGR